MANQIVQRLIAAGASPQKAQAFAQQYTKQVQKAQPGLGKPKDIQDAFDAEIAAFAAAAYPDTFKPPAITDPTIRDYVKGAYGEEVLDDINAKSFSFKAPDIQNLVKKNPNLEDTPDSELGLDAYIVKQLYFKQMPIGELKDILSNPTRQTELGISSVDPKTKVTKLITGALLPADYNALVEKYAAQDAAQQEEEQKQLESFLNSDKYYKVGLVTPKVKYGQTQNLAEGIIDFKTHPSVKRVIDSDIKKQEEKLIKSNLQIDKTYGPQGPQSSAAAGIKNPVGNVQQLTEKAVFDRFEKSGAKPFLDEVKRRESLKKTTTLGK
jgi:hypothetical protein